MTTLRRGQAHDRWRGRRVHLRLSAVAGAAALLLPVAGPLDPVAASAPTPRAASAVQAAPGSGTPVPAVTGPLPVTADVVPVRRCRPPASPAGPGPRRLRRGGVPRERPGQRVRLARHLARRSSAPPDVPVHDPGARAPPGGPGAVQRQRRRRDAEPVEPVRPEHRLGPHRTTSSSARATCGWASPPSRRPWWRSRPSTRSGTPGSPSPTRSRWTTRATARPPTRSSPATAPARPRTAWSGTCTARSARGCTAGRPATR